MEQAEQSDQPRKTDTSSAMFARFISGSLTAPAATGAQPCEVTALLIADWRRRGCPRDPQSGGARREARQAAVLRLEGRAGERRVDVVELLGAREGARRRSAALIAELLPARGAAR
jgi:hypothetical protein